MPDAAATNEGRILRDYLAANWLHSVIAGFANVPDPPNPHSIDLVCPVGVSEFEPAKAGAHMDPYVPEQLKDGDDTPGVVTPGVGFLMTFFDPDLASEPELMGVGEAPVYRQDFVWSIDIYVPSKSGRKLVETYVGALSGLLRRQLWTIPGTTDYARQIASIPFRADDFGSFDADFNMWRFDVPIERVFSQAQAA